jgi:hypothetical protein
MRHLPVTATNDPDAPYFLSPPRFRDRSTRLGSEPSMHFKNLCEAQLLDAD